MPSTTKVKLFFESEVGKQLRQELIEMVKDPSYNTRPSYTATSTDELLFVDKHMNYMSTFPNMDYHQYLSNLKLKTKVRGIRR